jgi:hypothetical protein
VRGSDDAPNLHHRGVVADEHGDAPVNMTPGAPARQRLPPHGGDPGPAWRASAVAHAMESQVVNGYAPGIDVVAPISPLCVATAFILLIVITTVALVAQHATVLV